MVKKILLLFLMLSLSACGTLNVTVERTPSPKSTEVDFTSTSLDGIGMISSPTSPAIITMEPTAPAPTNTALALSNAGSEQYQVITRPNPSDGRLTDIYIQKISTQDETLFMTLSDVNSGNYHIGEYHNGNLYIMRRMGNPEVDQNWSDQLWRYDSQENGKMLFSNKGLDFRIAADESYAAVAYQTTDTYASMLAFINKNGEVVREFNFDPTGLYLNYPNQWSDNDNQFWGTLQIEVTPKTIYQVTISNWDVKKFDVTPLNIGDEHELNANTGKIVYSDYPVFFMADNRQQFTDSGTEVKLFLYDLNTQALQTIATSIARPFSPKWLDNNTFEYDDPNGGARIEYTVK